MRSTETSPAGTAVPADAVVPLYRKADSSSRRAFSTCSGPQAAIVPDEPRPPAASGESAMHAGSRGGRVMGTVDRAPMAAMPAIPRTASDVPIRDDFFMRHTTN